MPISSSAKKSLRKALKNNKENVSFKNKLRTIVKKFLASPTAEG
jgi:ribosomal protein S20